MTPAELTTAAHLTRYARDPHAGLIGHLTEEHHLSRDEFPMSRTAAKKRHRAEHDAAAVKETTATAAGPGHWDLQEVLEPVSDVCTDFEGFAGPDEILRILGLPEVRDHLGYPTQLPAGFKRDMLIHWLFESIDQAGYVPTEAEAIDFLNMLEWIFASRRWLKVRDEDLTGK